MSGHSIQLVLEMCQKQRVQTVVLFQRELLFENPKAREGAKHEFAVSPASLLCKKRKIVLCSNFTLVTTEERIVEFDPYLMATLATREESRPPDSRTPKGASDISRFTTALMKLCCSKHSAVTTW